MQEKQSGCRKEIWKNDGKIKRLYLTAFKYHAVFIYQCIQQTGITAV